VTLADQILASHFTLSDVEGAIEVVSVKGAEGLTSDNPHPVLSLLRWTTTDVETARTALDEVYQRFSGASRGFDWMTGPACDEAGLTSLLAEHGFIDPPLDVAAMVRPLTSQDTDSVPEVSGAAIDLAAEDEHPDCFHLMAKAFDVPPEVGEAFHRGYLNRSEKQYTDLYTLRLDSGELVGVGYVSYLNDTNAVLLRVSSVEEAHRGHGYYKALVARRLADAAKAGRTQAFVHAYSPSSKKVLAEMGFETAGSLKLHRWRP